MIRDEIYIKTINTTTIMVIHVYCIIFVWRFEKKLIFHYNVGKFEYVFRFQ